MPLTRPTRRPLARLATLVAVAATLACRQDSYELVEPLRASGGPSGNSHGIVVHNAGGTALSGVSILTGEDVPPVTVPQLAPGARTEMHHIGVLHENPIVSATVAGQRRTYHPVEGFAGFNRQLEPGGYVIALRWNAGSEALEISVEPLR